LRLTPGQQHDSCQADALLADHRPKNVIADKAYDNNKLIGKIRRRGGRAVIPSLKVRRVRRRIKKHLYRRRNLIERFINRLKHYRRIATRYEKTARNFIGFLHLAATLEWLK
jgi:transposase